MASQGQGANVAVSSQRSLGHLAPFQYRLLSIQSCVTYGYVGNKSAMFPLQLLGVDVDPVHTVTLSNHAGYPVVKGHRSTKEDLSNIFGGLEGNQMHLSYDLILSGYLGNAEAANAVAAQLESWVTPLTEAAAEGSSPVSLRRSTAVLQRWLAGRPSARRNRLLYVCDPVLGDNGKLYVANDVVESYRSRLLNYADVVLPNGFEASLLSSLPLHSLSTAAAVAEYFHKVHGVPLVIIKSFHDKERFPFTDANSLLPSMLTMYASYSPHSIGGGGGDECSPETFAVDVPLMEGQYSGTGDLFASLFLGYLLEPGRTLKEAVLCSVRSMQDILRATKQASASLPPEQQLRALELRFLQHSALLLNPSNDSTVMIVEKE